MQNTPRDPDKCQISHFLIDAHHHLDGRGEEMEEQLEGKHLQAIYSDFFDLAGKWYDFGLALGLLYDDLDKIRHAHRDEPNGLSTRDAEGLAVEIFPQTNTQKSNRCSSSKNS